MNKLIIPALLLLCNASVAMAQTVPSEGSASNQSQRLVQEALNYSVNHPVVMMAPAPAQPAAGTQVTSGIGPSSNMAQPGDYGYSSWNDLRQLNF